MLAFGTGYLGREWAVRRWGSEQRGQAASGRARIALLAWIGAIVGYLAHGWGWVPIGRWVGGPAWLASGLLAFGGALALVVVGLLLWLMPRKGGSPGQGKRTSAASGTAPLQ